MKVYIFIVAYNYCGNKRYKWVSPCVYHTETEAKAAAYGNWPDTWSNVKFYVKCVKV